ncbi:AEC family transporter [Acidaminococcus timonensis]|jgi:predicted permease|uniref:AEC family transporter n=3 Tax=Acidaminococcus TaxID=904 RepID=UPI0026EF3C6A|nr:AEC family transporter [Acidaminococcus timonensis]MDD6570344.1 AEC family transporter [Acidaminococcus sp.]
MENFWIAAGAVLPLMIYMGIGLLAKKRYGFTSQIISYFNKLVFGVFLPTNMFYSVYFTDMSKVVKPAFVGFTVAGLLVEYLVGFALVMALVKDNRKRGAMIQAFYRSNFILLGVPLVENLYGPEATALPLMLVAIVVPLYNVLAVFTLETFRGGTFNPVKILWGVLKNPMILGALGGLLCKFLPFPLPAALLKCLKAIAASTTPFSLIVLGASFTLQGAVSELKELVFTVFGRLVLAPAIVLGAAIYVGIRGLELASIMAFTATPCAVASFAMAQQMDSDGELAGNCVIFSSALSCLTMFLWVFAFKNLGLL